MMVFSLSLSHTQAFLFDFVFRIHSTHTYTHTQSPWVGNAVGALNHKFFVLFIFYTMMTCIVSLFLLLLRSIHCGFIRTAIKAAGGVSATDLQQQQPQQQQQQNESAMSNSTLANEVVNAIVEGGQGRRMWRILTLSSQQQQQLDDPYPLLSSPNWYRTLSSDNYPEECAGYLQSTSVILLFIASIIFLIFTICMMVEQVDAIQTNASKIARMKMSVGQAGTELRRVTEEFNEMFGGEDNKVTWHWFMPLPVEFPRGMGKVVLGYEWDETFDPVPYYEGGDNDEEEGKIVELTSRPPPLAAGMSSNPSSSLSLSASASASSLSSSKPQQPVSTNNNGLDVSPGHAVDLSTNGEEATFAGTPVLPNKANKKLTKRSNSKDSSHGHLT